MPTPEEAAAVGQMMYYDRFYQKKAFSLLGEALDPSLSDEETEKMLADYTNRATLWPQGAVALAKPAFFTKQYIKCASHAPFIHQMLEIIETIQNENAAARVAVYAAGQRGQDFCRIAVAMGLDVRFFVDGNTALHGKTRAGKPVRALDTVDSTEIDVYVISALRYAGEITETLAKKYRRAEYQPSIFSF